MSKLAAVIISLFVQADDGSQYDMQTWEPKNAIEFAQDWKACNDQAREINSARTWGNIGRGGLRLEGPQAKCKLVDPATLAPAQPQAASLQTIHF